MDAVTMLHSRVSVPKLVEPGPSKEQLETIQLAALRAADHARLRPWRFLVIEGQGLETLGDVFAQVEGERERERESNKKPGLDESQLAKARAKPLRAPMLIVVIAVTSAHPKVPEIEQLLSAGCAAQNMLNAAHALGLGAIWRTGDIAYDKNQAKHFTLSDHEKVIGFIYLGTPAGSLKPVPNEVTDDFFEHWPKGKND